MPRRSHSRFAALLLAFTALATVLAPRTWAAPPPPTQFTTLPDILGAFSTRAFGINNRGQIVGTYLESDLNTHNLVSSR